MDDLAPKLDQLIHDVWQAMLGEGLASCEVSEPWKPAEDPGMMACIQITGEWEGAVTLECTARLARGVTEEMLGMAPGEAAEEEIHDALGELVNVVGGNLKALLDGGAQLSLPAVTSGVDYRVVVPGSTATCQLGFKYSGEPVRVGLLARHLQVPRPRPTPR